MKNTLPDTFSPRSRLIGLYLLIGAVVAAVFLPTVRYGFLDGDDVALITSQPWFYGVEWHHLWQVWNPLQFFQGNSFEYMPLRDTVYLLEACLFGQSAAGYHFVQLLLQTANALLFFTLLRRFISLPVAALAALWWGIHPVVVEPVAWISCTKDLLMGLCFFLTLLALERHREKPALWWGSAAILCKRVAVDSGLLFFLPGTTRRQQRYGLILLAIGAVATGYHIWGDLRTEHVIPISAEGELPHRAWPAAAQIITHNFIKAVLPINLLFKYDGHEAWGLFHPQVAAGILLVALWGAGIFWFWRRQPHLSRGLVFAAIAFLPYAQLLPTRLWMVDRYEYLFLAGLIWTVAAAIDQAAPHRRRAGLIALTVYVVAFVPASLHRLPVWHDSESYFTTQMRDDPKSDLGWRALGAKRFREGRYVESIQILEEGSKQAGPRTVFRILLALNYGSLGDLDTTKKYLDIFLETASPFEKKNLKNEVAAAYILLGNYPEAEKLLQEFLAFKHGSTTLPDRLQAHMNLYSLYVRSHRPELGIAELDSVLAENPRLVAARLERAIMRYVTRQPCNAIYADLAYVRQIPPTLQREVDAIHAACDKTP